MCNADNLRQHLHSQIVKIKIQNTKMLKTVTQT